ncbi:MAG: hypothetical protein M1840_001718 [Geoglossum simile]|nr:MAG: hypothetical protein M1840_001718 [Geoglossum simile]
MIQSKSNAVAMLSPTSSAFPSTTPPSAPITSLPSPPESSEKARKAPTRLPSSVVQALEICQAPQSHALNVGLTVGFWRGIDCARVAAPSAAYMLRHRLVARELSLSDRDPPDDQWIKIHIQVGDYEILQQQLRQEDLWGYVEDKIRYDWNPYTGELIYRMTTATHETFTFCFVDDMLDWVKTFKKVTDVNLDLSSLASLVHYHSSSNIFYHNEDGDDGSSKHSPDGSLACAEANYPGIVVETSFSPKHKDLPKLAEDYILSSLGNISVVIGFDIDYRGTKKGTVSVWRPEEGFHKDDTPFLRVKTIVDAEPFRNSDGSLVSDGNLTLSFGDLFPACMTSSITRPLPTYTIPYLKFAGFLQFSEAYQQVTESKAGYGRKKLPTGMKVYRRLASPEGTLSPRRERAVAESGGRAEERAMR